MVARLTSAVLYIGHVTVPKGVLPYSAKFYRVLAMGQVSRGGPVIFLDWVNSGAPWWRRILTGLDPVDLTGWMEWI